MPATYMLSSVTAMASLSSGAPHSLEDSENVLTQSTFWWRGSGVMNEVSGGRGLDGPKYFVCCSSAQLKWTTVVTIVGPPQA